MRVTTQIEDAERLSQDAINRMDEQDAKIQALPDDTPLEERDFHVALFEKYKQDAARTAGTLERLVAISKAREATAPQAGENTAEERVKITVENEPKTYRPDAPHSFFRDVYKATLHAEPEARERLDRHTKEMKVEERDISTTVTAGGNFVPPAYLGELFAEFPRAGRPFADVLPKQPLMAKGMNITIPRITTGTTVSTIITENSTTVSETDIVEALITIHVNTFAGQQDVSQQLLDRSDPGIDSVIFADLREAYDQYLDTQLISGTGANNQHLGVRAVSSPNTVTYTDATPTAAELVPPIYNAIQLVASNRYASADTILMHPRRAAWLASNLSSTFPLFQLGALNQASGTQNNGMVENIGGLRVVLDANVGVLYGAGTNQDEVYVLRTADMILWEGPLQARVLPEVGSGTLTVRLQLFAYSAFASARQPKSISISSGTGLTAPTF